MQTKSELRIQQKAALARENLMKRKREEEQLYALLFQTPEWQSADSIAVTLSMEFELNTSPIIIKAWEKNKRVLVPKIINHKMIFVEIDSNTRYQTGMLNIREPLIDNYQAVEQLDLVIVPGLAFTVSGKRLGFGAGYYDRFLEHYAGHTISVALSTQLLDNLPTENHDQTVQRILYAK